MALFAGSNEFVLRVTTDKILYYQRLTSYVQVNNRTFLYIFLRSGTDS